MGGEKDELVAMRFMNVVRVRTVWETPSPRSLDVSGWPGKRRQLERNSRRIKVVAEGNVGNAFLRGSPR